MDTTLPGGIGPVGTPQVMVPDGTASHSHGAQIKRSLRCERLAAHIHARLLDLNYTLDIVL